MTHEVERKARSEVDGTGKVGGVGGTLNNSCLAFLGAEKMRGQFFLLKLPSILEVEVSIFPKLNFDRFKKTEF